MRMMNPHMAIGHLLHDLPTAATATFLALFPIVNPLGGIPMFFSLTADYKPEERRRTALKIALDVIAILVTFMLFGRFVLNFFGISLPVLKIAGGLIVANTAWGMVTGSSRMTMEESSEALTKAGYFTYPHGHADALRPRLDRRRHGASCPCRSFSCLPGHGDRHCCARPDRLSLLCLGGPFVKRLGPGVMGAINRIFGFLILAIAVQLVWNGAADFRGE